MLLPARAVLRRSFSAKSLATFGFEVEGQSYRLQSKEGESFSTANPLAELRRSEIRVRLAWDKAITDFIWFNVQAGVRYNYRFTFDENANAKEHIQSYNIGLPLYFRFGINLVSP